MTHSGMHYPASYLLFGALLLLFGRKLFWLFVAAAGFFLGLEFTPVILPHQPEIILLISAAILGIIGAVLAIFVQKIAVALAGFIAGGYLATLLFTSPYAGFHRHLPGGLWLVFLLGGILGIVVMLAFFNWALIIFSSLHGAHLVTRGLAAEHIHGFALRRTHTSLLLIILVILGIVVQAATYRRPRTGS